MDGGLEGDAEGEGAVGAGNAGIRRTATAYAELVRLPNLFTAPPDVLLGAALVAAAGGSVSPVGVVGLGAASMTLYAGGTVLNDAFDAQVDARERPERPIPSDRIDRRIAFGLGFAFLLGGVALTIAFAGESAALVAGLLALAIVLYDGVLKGTPVGFLAMGATRGCNVVLGTTAGAVAALREVTSAMAVPPIVAAYIAAVTFMAARETEGGNRGAVATAGAGGLAAVAVLGWHLVALDPGAAETILAALLAGGFLLWIGRPLRDAYREPVPETVGPAVGACVVGLVIVDAAFAAATGLGWAVATLAFLLPARVLSRVFEVT